MTRPAHEPNPQLSLALGGEGSRCVKGSPRANARITTRIPRVVTERPELFREPRFLPVLHVPRDRSECPTQRPCPHVKCEWNLLREDPEAQGGRPGLSHVQRDSKTGHTLKQCGDLEDDKQTTLRPVWLTVRGLEIMREVKVYASKDGDGAVSFSEVREGTLGYWLEHLSDDEPVLLFDADSGERIGRAVLRKGALALDAALPEYIFSSSSCVVLTRVRETPSCGLDVIEEAKRRGENALTTKEVGLAIGRSSSLVRKMVRRALVKLRAMGVGAEEMNHLIGGDNGH